MTKGNIADKIADTIVEIVGKANNEGMRYPVMSGVVRGMDVEAGTCDVELSVDDDGTPTPGVLLNVVTTNMEGLTLVPADGSQVWVAEIDGQGKWGLVKCSELTTVVVKIGGTAELEVTDGQVVMNGGENGGIPIIAELVSKINRLENKLNALVTKFNLHTHLYIPGIPGTPTVASLTPAVTETAISPITAVADIENPNVTH